MNKHDKNNKDESLLNVFLSTSNSIDEEIEKAKEIIKQEGLDPDVLQEEGISFIKALQQRVKAESKPVLQPNLADLVKRLVGAGLSKTFLEKRIIPSALLADWKKQRYRSEVSAVTSLISSIFSWEESEIWGTGELVFSDTPAGKALLKAPVNSNLSQIRAYSHYAYYLARLIARSYTPSDVEGLPEDIDEFKSNYIKRYRSFDLSSLIKYAWELGFCVLPLNDPGIFHGACWNINGRRVIVLKQNTKYHARWIFDLLHELYHALAHLDELDSSIIETQELNPFLNNDTLEEREANTFAHQVLFGDRTEDILNQCVQQTQGKMERLKSVVQRIARQENIREDILANFVAFRLSLDDQNWWGPAAALQITDQDPFTIARQLLLNNITMKELKPMDYNLLQIAISNN